MLTVSISILCSPSKGFAVRREWDLLHAVLRFWDPEDHVFRFGLDEICSTIEDFSAILDINKNLSIIMPVLRHSYSQPLCGMLGLPLQTISRMFDL